MDVAFPLYTKKGRRFGGGVANYRVPFRGWRIHVELFFGFVFYVEKSVEKVVPKGPHMDPKSRPKSTERVFRRGLEKGTSKRTLSRTRKSEILLLFTIL